MNKASLQTLVDRWKNGKVTADEAMRELSESLSIPKQPVKKRKEVEYDVSEFMSMANAIVKSRTSKSSI